MLVHTQLATMMAKIKTQQHTAEYRRLSISQLQKYQQIKKINTKNLENLLPQPNTHRGTVHVIAGLVVNNSNSNKKNQQKL